MTGVWAERDMALNRPAVFEERKAQRLDAVSID